MILHYYVCNACAAVVLYGEPTPDTPDETMTFIEDRGPLALVGAVDPGAGGYWGCEACQEVTIGTGAVLELEL